MNILRIWSVKSILRFKKYCPNFNYSKVCQKQTRFFEIYAVFSIWKTIFVNFIHYILIVFFMNSLHMYVFKIVSWYIKVQFNTNSYNCIQSYILVFLSKTNPHKMDCSFNIFSKFLTNFNFYKISADHSEINFISMFILGRYDVASIRPCKTNP